jgi:hypothetical protein
MFLPLYSMFPFKGGHSGGMEEEKISAQTQVILPIANQFTWLT